jgi:hypothetical protein
MSSSEMSAGFSGSVGSSDSEWGEGDPEMGMICVHLRVLGGQSVWLLAFHELMAADDRREFVEQRLAEADFTPDSLGPRMTGAPVLNRGLYGYAVAWTTRNMQLGEVDRVLAALGLYHV